LGWLDGKGKFTVGLDEHSSLTWTREYRIVAIIRGGVEPPL